MNFLSILKKVAGIAVNVEHVIAPIGEMIPGPIGAGFMILDGIFQRVEQAIKGTEAANPADGQGNAKSALVIGDFNAALEMFQQIAAVDGKKLVYDATALKAGIDAQVLAYNSWAKVKASFKIVAI